MMKLHAPRRSDVVPKNTGSSTMTDAYDAEGKLNLRGQQPTQVQWREIREVRLVTLPR